jgi:hypothetical protein
MLILAGFSERPAPWAARPRNPQSPNVVQMARQSGNIKREKR